MEKSVILQEARTWSLNSLGSKFIFDARIRKYGRWIAWLTVLGLVTPLLFGGLLLNFNLDSGTINAVKIAAAILSLIQLIISAWAIVYKWGGFACIFAGSLLRT